MLGPVGALVASFWAARGVSSGQGKDLEWEWAESFACSAGKLLAVTATRQIGGPLGDPKAAQMGEVKYGFHPTTTSTFSFNASKCLLHVRKSLSGSIAARHDRIRKKEEEAKAHKDKPTTVHITPGEPMSLGDMMRKAQVGKAVPEEEEEELSECERAKHSHDRCNNDNPPGKHGFVNCCRALAGVLFACAEDYRVLPSHLRSLYLPSYAHFCVPQGHAELPKDYSVEQKWNRVSEFQKSRADAEADGCDLAGLGGVKGEGKEGGVVRLDTANAFVLALSVASDCMLAAAS